MVGVDTVMYVLPQEVFCLCDPSGRIAQMRLGSHALLPECPAQGAGPLNTCVLFGLRMCGQCDSNANMEGETLPFFKLLRVP